MRFYVYVLEAWNLPAENTCVKLQLGRFRSKTRVFQRSANPAWNEEFVFRVHDMEEELVVSVYYHGEGGGGDGSGVFGGSGELLGRVRVPVWSVMAEENHTLPPTWFSLESPRAGKFSNSDCGKILLTLSLHGRGHDNPSTHDLHSSFGEGVAKALEDQRDASPKKGRKKARDGKRLVKSLANHIEKIFTKHDESEKSDDHSEVSSSVTTPPTEYEDCSEEVSSNFSLVEALEMMQGRHAEQDVPENLAGGVLVDQTYMASSNELNLLLFSPNSEFRKNLAELQGITGMQEGPWMWKSGDRDESQLTRNVTYTKAASKLVKATKATEEQTYVLANGKAYAVTVTVSTPDVPYGNTFKIELLYKITPGPDLSSGAESCRLVVSWGIHFLQHTMMRGMIESGAKQGLKESFDHFADLLAQNFKVVELAGLAVKKDQVLAALNSERQSDWELASKYFFNPTVFSTVLMFLYVLGHIILSPPDKIHGLEVRGLDLPDSVGELVTCGILVLQLERVYYMVRHFVQARLKRVSDHGVKAQGEGWVLTVALIEGSDLASLDAVGLSDPYVVFTCNGKTRTSSVKLQTNNPQWNEILEFDAMEEPPAVLDVEVFDFDGPFDQATSLGHAEINFLKHTSTELADMWLPLDGKLAQASQSKLHLRVFLDNKNGVETIKEYLTKMEKEVGRKFSLRSPHKNSTFQKIFELPPEEFLISDFSCSLRRRLHLQGRLYLSARIVGFYANLFGHKTKFYFLWDDIEDIQEQPPSLASVGSPTLVVILKKGRGFDARHGAKSQDDEGRLKFYFQSFVSFRVASRTIMALWKTRTMSPELRAQIAEEEQDVEEMPVAVPDAGALPDSDDLELSKIVSSELPVSMEALMTMFDGGELEYRVMGKSGCLNLVTTAWEPVKPDLLERRLCYKFSRHVSIFGGEVTCTQRKHSTTSPEGCIVNEVMALHNIPFSDHYRVHFRYRIERCALAQNACRCEVYGGIRWLKSAKLQQPITRNIMERLTQRVKEMLQLAEREIVLPSQHGLPR
uniref:C2 and GRAM domain-containing protein n=1 Tax=Kalanchoe fedtschenkoi TaxID=63787 RepID=A0A7N0VG44_KALFE